MADAKNKPVTGASNACKRGDRVWVLERSLGRKIMEFEIHMEALGKSDVAAAVAAEGWF